MKSAEILEQRTLLSSTTIDAEIFNYSAFAPQINLVDPGSFLSGTDSAAPLSIAQSFLRSQAASLGLTSSDIDTLQVVNNYQNAGSGVTHIYFQQVVNDIPVINSNLNINITPSGQVINVGSSILSGVGTETPNPSPQLTPVQALNSIVTEFGWIYEGTPLVREFHIAGEASASIIESAGISKAADIPARLRYVPRADGSLELVWLLNVQTTDGQSWYDASVSATDGSVLNVVDWSSHATYHAEEIPFENPLEKPPALIVDPELRAPNASPFGWHDTDGVAGAEFTDTRGNNVNAQEDKDANDTGGNRPDGGPSLVFNFPFDPALSAQANENASIVNLFYLNNVIHDVLYEFGFDEVSGNFQTNNYGKGGTAGDQVEADALDGSGLNNANFSTPPDGTSGRMQMYEFDATTPTRDSAMDSFIVFHEFGHGLSNRLTGGPANSGALQKAQSRGMGEGWSDFLGLMMVQKATDLQVDAYSTGNYVLGNPLNDPNGGIRNFPYSYNMAFNPTTYGYFNPSRGPHANGEIIASALWDLNWLMINGDGLSIAGKGYEPNIYNAESGKGNTELMKLFVEALKLQPANPTNLDFRDAMLQADLVLNGSANRVAIWTAFARRGMGFSADDGGDANSLAIEAFDIPAGLTLTLTAVPTTVAENAGNGAITGTVKRPNGSSTAQALTVTLSSSDTSEIRVPANVTIPVGAQSAIFPIDVVDDTLLDGTQTVLVTASASIGAESQQSIAQILVRDVEEILIEFDKTSVREDAGPGAATVTLTRSNVDTLSEEVVVQLLNGDPTEVSIPLTITIPAGSQSVAFPLDAVDDNISDGLQIATLTTMAAGYQPSSATIGVEDTEGILIDVIATMISEAAGTGATMVKISRTDSDGPFSVPMTQSYENSATYEIPDKSTIYSPISVPNQALRITDLVVTVSFQHQWLSDLDVYLISPSGTRVKLFADILSTSTQMTGTIFDDQASASILSGTGTFTGRFLPEELLSRFNNESPVGTWLLEVTDDNTSHFGRLQGWSMTMTTMGLQAATVVIRSSDVSKAAFQGSATKTVVIPANQSEILVPLDAVDNNILDGDTEVTISAISVDVAGLGLGDDKVIVTDKETLDLAVSTSSVSEAVVPSTITGTVTRRNTDISLPYTVAISSSHPGRLSVSSATVTIPAGQSAMDFPITVHDNSIVDGDVIVTLTATVPEYGDPVTADVTVLDYEPALVLSTSTPTVAENAGTFVAKVSRLGIDDSDRSIPLIVNLSAGPGLTVPATVTIPSGLSEMTFSVGIIDNALLDGNRSSSITASKNFYTLGTLAIAITDYESVTITLNKSSFLENAGSKAAIATVRRSDTGNLGQSLLVALESSDATELRVPASITIPAGLASVTFFVEAVDDSDIDGAKSVTITASVVEYVTGTATVVVQDHEPVVLTGPNAQTTTSRPTISWNAIAGTLRYDVWIDNLSTGVSQLLRNINVPTNSYVPPENLGIGRYRVWVRAIDQLEQAGFWSAARDFYISTRPTITSPQENLPLVGGAFPTIVWSAVPDATKYELWVDNITNGRVRVIYRAGTSALSTTSYVSTEGLGSGTYQIWVRALNTKGEAGFWSAAVTTKVVASPVVLQPADEGTFDRTPTFTWTAITGATNYDVWIANSKNNDVVFRDKFVRTTSFTATKDMAFGNYQIWVRAQNGDSFGVWSAAKAFSVGLPPQITSVKTVGTPAKPRFDWTGIAGTERYELLVYANVTNAAVINKTNLTDTTYTSPTTLAKGTYRVWIRAVSTMGEVTAWSSPVDLIIAWSELQKDSASLVYVSSKSTFSESDRQLTTGGFLNVSAEVQEPEPTALAVDEVTAAIKPPGNDTAISMNPVESAQKFAIDHDTVMSELPLADWWAEDSEPSRDNQIHSAAALATTAGLVVRRKQKSEDRRKRNRI
jgi:subtilisin-like proprotein convertase family protein